MYCNTPANGRISNKQAVIIKPTATEYLRLNQTDNALNYYEKLVNEHPAYVGTYYHLGKLYEALNRKEDAVSTYEKGMKAAREARDNHAYAELQSVYNELTGFGDDDD